MHGSAHCRISSLAFQPSHIRALGVVLRKNQQSSPHSSPAFRLTRLFLLIVASIPWHSHGEFLIRSRQLDGITYLYLADVATYYGMKLSRGDKTATLQSSSDVIDLTFGDRRTKINAIVGHFSFPPRLTNVEPMIAEPDLSLFLDPILRRQSLPSHPVSRIVIDPGHGGDDRGAAGGRYIEKKLVLQMSKMLAQLLEKQGYTVLLTRTTDTFISLEKRGEISRDWQADLFISIHCNSASTKSVSGIETFIVTPQDAPSTAKSKVQTKAVSGNQFDKLNSRLAYEIHRRLVNATGAKDRGIKYFRYQVLREAPCPAVLIENGFLSNDQEEKRLGDPEYQKLIVNNIAAGIGGFHRALSGK